MWKKEIINKKLSVVKNKLLLYIFYFKSIYHNKNRSLKACSRIIFYNRIIEKKKKLKRNHDSTTACNNNLASTGINMQSDVQRRLRVLHSGPPACGLVQFSVRRFKLLLLVQRNRLNYLIKINTKPTHFDDVLNVSWLSLYFMPRCLARSRSYISAEFQYLQFTTNF